MDVCDEPAIQNLCEEAVRDNGRLDVFFVNVGGFKTTFSLHYYITDIFIGWDQWKHKGSLL